MLWAVLWGILGVLGLLLSYSIIVYIVTYCAVNHKVVLMYKVEKETSDTGPQKIILCLNPQGQSAKKQWLWGFILSQIGVLGMQGNQKVIQKVIRRIGMLHEAQQKWKEKKERIYKRKKHQHLCTRHGGKKQCKCHKRKGGAKGKPTRVKLTKFEFK